MMATDYLDKYIESVSDLPAQLQRKFRLIRDLDEKSAKLQADVNEKCREQLAAAAAGGKTPGGSNKRPRLSPSAPGPSDSPLVAEITQGQAQLLSWAEEKMHIAFQVYDLVDKHIRELDEDLKGFASEVDNEAQSLGLGEQETACDRLGLQGGARVRGASAAAAAAAATSQQGRQKRKTADRRKGTDAATSADLAAAAAAAAAAAGGGLQLDAAADASQPRYCLCQNVSYGEMVACDNAECPVEWFHFACVGLTEQPKGKWYCPECAPQFQQKQHGAGHLHGHAGHQHHHQPPHKKAGRR